NGFYATLYLEDESLRISLHSAAWGFLVWLVIGVVVQLLAIYLMPSLVQRMPRELVRVLGVGLTLPPAIARTDTYGPPWTRPNVWNRQHLWNKCEISPRMSGVQPVAPLLNRVLCPSEAQCCCFRGWASSLLPLVHGLPTRCWPGPCLVRRT